MIHNNAPSYLSDFLPKRVNEAVSYDLLNHQNFQLPFLAIMFVRLLILFINTQAQERFRYIRPKHSNITRI